MHRTLIVAAILASAAGYTAAQAEDTPSRPVFAADGTVHVPAFDLPPSSLMSPEAVEAQKHRAQAPGGAPPADLPIAQVRKGLAAMLASQVDATLAAYPVDVSDEVIAGVPTRVFTPKGKPWDQKHVLINLHGGGFSMCWESCSMLESIPIAATGGYKVISVNYRMGPEAKHPAALEDATLVYRELLKRYKPQQIGVYGCSAGGALTGELAAWLPAHGLPEPGAAGIFGAGAVRFGSGDSAYIAGYTDGSFGAPPKAGEKGPDMTRGYFSGADMKDEIVSPALHPEVMAKFPPVLLITGTRAMDMSPAIVTNSALLKAGVDSHLVVGEGMGHCYIYQQNLPEARDAWQVIISFFRKNLH